MLMEHSRLCGVTEAAEELDVDRATVTRWLRAGKLTVVVKLPGRNGPYLLDRAAVKHLAAQRKGNH